MSVLARYAVAMVLLVPLVAMARGDGGGTPGAGPRSTAPTTNLSAKPLPPQGADEQANSHGRFSVFGTWNAFQAAVSLIQRFEENQHAHIVNYTPVVGSQIPGFFARHQCDVGITMDSFAPMPREGKASAGERFLAGRFVLAVAVNAKSPLQAISMRDLQTAFAANLMKAATWKDIKGSGSTAKIEIYHHPCLSPEWLYFQKIILFGGPYADDVDFSVRARHQKRSARQIISAIAKQENAIGFFRYESDRPADKRVRVLGIAKDKKSPPVPPTVATIADGSYPLADTITLHLHPKAPQSARDFCKFASGPDAAAIVKQAGLWPEYDLKKGTIEVRMREVRAHRGIQIAISGSPAWEGLMKEIGQEFSKADTAVEVQYHAGGQVESVGRFVHGGELVLLDSLLEDATVEKYDRPWRELQPRLVPIGCFAAAVVVHPSNPASELTFRQLHDILAGKLTKWGELAETDAPEPFMRGEDDKAEGGTSLPSPPAAAGGNGGGRKMDGKARNAPHVGHKPAQPPKAKQDPWAKRTIHLFGPPAEDPINQQVESQLQIGAEQAAVSRKPDAAKVLAAVARDPAAIGVIDLAKLPADDVSVKILAISLPDRESLRPSRWQVPEGYVLARPVQLYVSERASRSAKGLVELISSGQCAASIARVGLIPAALPPKKMGK